MLSVCYVCDLMLVGVLCDVSKLLAVIFIRASEAEIVEETQ